MTIAGKAFVVRLKTGSVTNVCDPTVSEPDQMLHDLIASLDIINHYRIDEFIWLIRMLIID